MEMRRVLRELEAVISSYEYCKSVLFKVLHLQSPFSQTEILPGTPSLS
jgi:hypothetical protein